MQKSKIGSQLCKICGASAIYSYVGVIVCPSCKMFFKRNAETRQGYFKCRFRGHCEVNMYNRRTCSSCRLKKCFTSGMQIEMLRSYKMTNNKKDQKKKLIIASKILSKRKEKHWSKQLSILKLQSNQLMLNINEWNLLLNLTRCYDKYNGFSLAQRYTHDQHDLPPKMRFKLASVTEFYISLINETQILFKNNPYFISLCSHDRSILFHNIIQYIGISNIYLIGYYTQLFDDITFYKSSEIIFGSNTLIFSKYVINQFIFDSIFVKLILTLFVFSTFNYTHYRNIAPINLMNIKEILYIQDMYTVLAWQYLINKYGYIPAIKYFSHLIRCLFLINDALMEAVKHKQYTNMIDFILKQTEETFLEI